MAKCNTIFCEMANAKVGDNFQCPGCAMMREQTYFSGPKLCLYIELFEFCGSFAILLTSLALKVQTTWEEEC